VNDNNPNDDVTIDGPDENASASLAALSALGALDADEVAEFQAYLSSSDNARADAASFAAVADLLGAGVEPPASLKASVMSQITAMPQLPAEVVSDVTDSTPATLQSTTAVAPVTSTPPADAPVVPSPTAPTPPAPAPTTKASAAGQSARVSKAQQKANSRWYSGPAAALVAAVALVAVLLGANVVTSALNNGNGLQQALRLAHIDAQPDAMRETIKLTNINDEKQVTATLVWSGALGESVLIVDGLATLPDEKTYELWYIGEDGPISAGIFNTHRSGESWRVLDGAMSAGDAVGVTVEPAGGSEQPTTDPLIVIHTS
jgi:hypothetical protein